MSIKKPGKNINIYIGKAVFYFFIFFLAIIKSSVFGWHGQNKIDDSLFFINSEKINKELNSSVYGVYENSFNEKNLSSFPLPPGKRVLAGKIDINIPLSALAEESVEPSKYLERLIAVNLRIKKLVEEYEELKEKAALLSQTGKTQIYGKNTSKSSSSLNNKKKEIHTSKEKIDKSLKHLVNFSPKADLASAPILNAKVLENEIKSIVYDYSSFVREKSGEGEIAHEKAKLDTNFKASTEFPWIFKFFIGIYKFIINYKYHILFCFLFGAFSLFFIMGRSRR
jgi:hypothetical protein